MFNHKNNTKEKNYDNLVTVTQPHSFVSEEFKTIRTNIQFSMVNKKFKTIMITSANPNEGKTTIISNIAVTFANQGKKVLLVDSDMRNPSLHRCFQKANNRGLTNLLTEFNLSLNSIITPTVIDNLYLLPSGPIPPNPSELLDSLRMDELIEDFKKDFDLVLFDLPPIISVTDAQILAPKVDGTVFVIRNGVVDNKDLAKSKELLDYAKANIVGAVFNGKKRKKDAKYGYYSYELEE